MHEPPPLALRVWGELACFTRPELKVERVSYEVMTPSAARGILEAVFWKPEFTWRIERIRVLRPIRHFSILRNEVEQSLSPDTISTWMRNGKQDPFLADGCRSQRHTLALRDVAYVIEARMVLQASATVGLAKYVAQFQRRVHKGQCYVRPYMGCREFPAYFGEADPEEPSIPVSNDLGLILFDLKYGHSDKRVDPVFFSGCLKHGVLEVPQDLYQEVWR